MTTKRLGYLIPVAVSVIYFLARKEVIPSYLYLILSLPACFYFFPGLLFFNMKEIPVTKSENRSQLVFSSLIFSTILVLSIISLFIDKSKAMNHVYSFFAMICTFSAIYWFIKEEFNYKVITYLCFMILIVGIIAI